MHRKAHLKIVNQKLIYKKKKGTRYPMSKFCYAKFGKAGKYVINISSRNIYDCDLLYIPINTYDCDLLYIPVNIYDCDLLYISMNIYGCDKYLNVSAYL